MNETRTAYLLMQWLSAREDTERQLYRLFELLSTEDRKRLEEGLEAEIAADGKAAGLSTVRLMYALEDEAMAKIAAIEYRVGWKR